MLCPLLADNRPIIKYDKILTSLGATQEPALYEAVPVCEICYFIYLLYKSKLEKQRCWWPLMQVPVKHILTVLAGAIKKEGIINMG